VCRRDARFWAGSGMNELTDFFRLDGRVAIVTGASRGIGLAIARGLVAAGAQVTGVGRTQVPSGGIAGFNYAACDITSTTSFSELVKRVFNQAGRIDILVNAAGITLPVQAATDPSAAFRQTLISNLTAVFDCCHAVIPCMQASAYGSIINVTSIGAAQGFPGNPGYVASKGGLAALTRALALDYGMQGIRVNSLVPGYIRTAMTEISYADPERREVRAKRTMLGRWGEPLELVGAAIFLASPASSYVTGSDLFVDGGWTAKGL
jgi:NAD(P)-dependent dehydrogenase (short-subunit alcohol dehydrogenase family)